MKYVIDIDAFKACLELLESPVRQDGCDMVRIGDVKELIDRFPKEQWDIEPILNYRAVDC